MKEGLSNLSELDLPYWMIFILAILVIVVPVITDIVRQKRFKKYEDKYREVIDNLVINQDSLYRNFNMLLDVLYDKYANNLTLEVSKQIIELVYTRTKNCIVNRIQDHLHDEDKYKDGKVDIEKIRSDIKMFISTKYYQDVMILNKMTCKGNKLSDHLSKHINHEEVTDKIIALITIYTSHNIYKACKHVRTDVDSYFNVLINKAKSFIENQTL